MEDPVLPVAVVIELGAVIAIADVVYGYPIAIDFSPRCFSDISLPIARARWLKRNPPGENNDEAYDCDNETKRSVVAIQQRAEDYPGQVDRPNWLAKGGRREIKIKSRRRPACGWDCDKD